MTGTVEPNEDYRTAGQQLWRRLRRLGEEDGERQKYDGRNGWTWAGTYADAIRAEWPKLAAAGLTRARSQLPRWTARSVICLARRRGSGGESSWWIADEWEPAPSGMERKTGQVKKPRRKTTTAKVTRPPEPPAADFFQDPPPGALPEFIPRATRLGSGLRLRRSNCPAAAFCTSAWTRTCSSSTTKTLERSSSWSPRHEASPAAPARSSWRAPYGTPYRRGRIYATRSRVSWTTRDAGRSAPAHVDLRRHRSDRDRGSGAMARRMGRCRETPASLAGASPAAGATVPRLPRPDRRSEPRM
jgi:hypothetical protein